MIKNIVFDVGQVLMSYTPENYLKNLGFSEKTVQTLRKAIFESTLWEAGDRGIISTEEIWEGFRKNVPGLKKEVQTVYDNLGDVVELMPYAEDWVKTLKEQGYHLYILSNYAEHTYQLSSHKMKFLPYMDGTLFSYVYKMAKPDREIYENSAQCINSIPGKPYSLMTGKTTSQELEPVGSTAFCFRTMNRQKKTWKRC